MQDKDAAEVMQMLGRLDQRITGVADDLREHNNKIEDHLKEDDRRIDSIERWVHDQRIRGEEREKYQGANPVRVNVPPVTPQVASIKLDPTVTKAVVTFLTAATGFLIFLQTQGG